MSYEIHKDLRDDWINKLYKSGNRQCHEVLADGELRCALGILGEVVCEKFPNDFYFKDSQFKMVDTPLDRFCDADDFAFYFLVGEDEEKLRFLPKRLVEEIIYMNDDKKMSFSEIADWLRENTFSGEQSFGDYFKGFVNKLFGS